MRVFELGFRVCDFHVENAADVVMLFDVLARGEARDHRYFEREKERAATRRHYHDDSFVPRYDDNRTMLLYHLPFLHADLCTMRCFKVSAQGSRYTMHDHRLMVRHPKTDCTGTWFGEYALDRDCM